jgi:hypothetical protein
MNRVWSAPGKVFLLGEYSVLAEGAALLAAVGPRFRLSTESFAGAEALQPHPLSPVARIRGLELPHGLFFADPWLGAGGFGASTAQVALLALSQGRDLQDAETLRGLWVRYREASTPSDGHTLAPSGADLVAQCRGGVTLFAPKYSAGSFKTRAMGILFEALSGRMELRVLQATHQAGRKVPTHDHIRTLTQNLPALVKALQPIVERGVLALEKGDPEEFGRTLSEYGDRLGSLDLEDGATRRDRIRLAEVPGVLGIKGTGALQADALVAALDPARLDLAQWRGAVKELGLRDLGSIPCSEEPAK